jgi:hypothetical protein
MLKIFSDRAYVPPDVEHLWQLSPFWGLNDLEHNSVQPKRLARYLKEGASIFELTNLESADFALFPAEFQRCNNPERRPLLCEFTQLAARANKQTIVFTGGDLEHSLPDFDGYEFHTSLYRSNLRKNCFAMPATIGDIVEEELGGHLPVLRKEQAPSVGFCGFAPPLAMPIGKEAVKEHIRDLMYGAALLSGTHVGYAPRVKVLRALKKARRSRTNILLRGRSPFTWAFGILTQDKAEADPAMQRREYLDNLVSSPYTLCVRGRGNYSLRFYEALCCGRIPVFINTDCVLPLENVIDWKNYCVWIEERDIPHIDAIIAEFHAALSDAQFKDLQLACRKLWLNYLSPESFMRNLPKNFS